MLDVKATMQPIVTLGMSNLEPHKHFLAFFSLWAEQTDYLRIKAIPAVQDGKLF